jgi:hypothetical protein
MKYGNGDRFMPLPAVAYERHNLLEIAKRDKAHLLTSRQKTTRSLPNTRSDEIPMTMHNPKL